MKTFKLFLVALMVITLHACGDSDSDDATSEIFTLSGNITIDDPDSWIQGEVIEVGLFTGTSTVPKYRQTLDHSQASTTIAFSFADVTANDYTCKVFTSEGGLYKADIYNYTAVNVAADVDLGSADITLLNFDRIQNQIFNQCLLCHGAAASGVEAGLNLLADSSYNNLVNIASKNSDLMRVKPEESKHSYLIHVLEQDDLSFAHAASSTASDNDVALVKAWIDNGALAN